MGEAELLIGDGDDADTHLRQIARFIRGDNEAERRRSTMTKRSPP
jgi:hypothetical protein